MSLCLKPCTQGWAKPDTQACGHQCYYTRLHQSLLYPQTKKSSKHPLLGSRGHWDLSSVVSFCFVVSSLTLSFQTLWPNVVYTGMGLRDVKNNLLALYCVDIAWSHCVLCNPVGVYHMRLALNLLRAAHPTSSQTSKPDQH